MSTTKKVLIALVSMVMIILISYSSYWGMQYNKAIRLIEEKSYAEAEDILLNSHVSNLYDKNGFVGCYARMCQYDSVEDALSNKFVICHRYRRIITVFLEKKYRK